jgi:hypothetical protein
MCRYTYIIYKNVYTFVLYIYIHGYMDTCIYIYIYIYISYTYYVYIYIIYTYYVYIIRIYILYIYMKLNDLGRHEKDYTTHESKHMYTCTTYTCIHTHLNGLEETRKDFTAHFSHHHPPSLCQVNPKYVREHFLSIEPPPSAEPLSSKPKIC